MRKLSEHGVVAAEFALLLPVLLSILFGTIEFGMIMYGREVVTNASREGARAGIIQRTPAVTAGEIVTVVTRYLAGTGINPAQVTITVPASGGGTGTLVTVTAIYKYPWLIPYLPKILGLPSPLSISMTTTMRHE